MESNIEISIPIDEDGYASFICEFCNGRFKLEASEVQSDDVTSIFCPLCGIKGELTAFLSSELIEAVEVIAGNIVADMFNDFTKNLKRSYSNSKTMSITSKPIPKQAEIILNEQNDLEVVQFECCNKSAKVHASYKCTGIVYCSYCGVNK